MMRYELFKEKVAERFLNYMPPEFQGYSLVIHPITKVNRTLDAMCIFPKEKSKQNMSPTIYINIMYEHYLDCKDLEEVLKRAAESMLLGIKQTQNFKSIIDFESAGDNIVMTLVNTEQNRELLENVPNRPFQDLSIIYRWVVDQSQDGISSALVKNDLAEQMGMTEETLYQVAVENTKRIFPPTVKPINELIKKLYIQNGMPEDIVNLILGEMSDNCAMYVVSNDIGINGAASLLYEDVLHQLADRLRSDLYIIPSSIHETIVVSTNLGNPDSLAQMVNEVNLNEVVLEERLSNQVYYYDKDLRKISMATDTPNKRLDDLLW